MKLIELDLSSIPFGQPIPFALRGTGGALLAGKGFVIHSQEDLKKLILRGHTLYVDTDESEDAYRAYLAQLQALLHSEIKSWATLPRPRCRPRPKTTTTKKKTPATRAGKIGNCTGRS